MSYSQKPMDALGDFSEPNLPQYQPSERSMMSADSVHESLANHVEQAVRQYFKMLADAEPTNLYDLMLSQLEKPLLSVVLEQTRGNQSKTAEILGLNRGTLRKKIKAYDLM